MNILVFLFILSMISCGNDSEISKKDERRLFFNQLFTYALLTGIINTSPDLCGEDRSRSTLISSNFSASETFTDTSRNNYYSAPKEANLTHIIEFQTLSANCNSFTIAFDNCKSNRKLNNFSLPCTPTGSINGNGSSVGV